MTSTPIISVRNVTKTYRLYNRNVDRIIETFHPLRRRYHRPFDALRDVSFELQRGRALGIIGRNGSGKSTLLQIICGIVKPTIGSVEVHGKVAALLELGAGFNPDFTGRENVYLNAAILGYRREQINERFDEIAGFADIGDFIDQPVKRYSSGMYVRLAFAVQACMEPDILIVDEALSVGDFFFQQKCLARMRTLRENQVTLLFVSHDMGIVRDLCDESVYLHEGQLVFFGDSRKAVQLYFQETPAACAVPGEAVSSTAPADASFLPSEFRENAVWIGGNCSPSGRRKKSEILAVTVIDSAGRPTMKARIGETLRFRMLFRSHTREPLHASLTFKNRYDQVIFSSGSYICGLAPLRMLKETAAIFEFELQCMVEAGLYSFSFNVSFEGKRPNRGIPLDETPWLGPLTVEWDYNNHRAPFLGLFKIPGTCRFFRSGQLGFGIREANHDGGDENTKQDRIL